MRQQLNEVITHTVCVGLVDRRVKYFKLVSLHKQVTLGGGWYTQRQRERQGRRWSGEGRAGMALKRNTRARHESTPNSNAKWKHNLIRVGPPVPPSPCPAPGHVSAKVTSNEGVGDATRRVCVCGQRKPIGEWEKSDISNYNLIKLILFCGVASSPTLVQNIPLLYRTPCTGDTAKFSLHTFARTAKTTRQLKASSEKVHIHI